MPTRSPKVPSRSRWPAQLVLTKTDLATADATDCLTKRRRHINPGAPLWRAPKTLSTQTLLSPDRDDVERWQPTDRHDHAPDDHHRHAEDLATLALSFDEPVDWTRFSIWLTMLLRRHGDRLLRVKGILNVADAENAGGGAGGTASRAFAAASQRVAQWRSAVTPGIHRPRA